jgi:hypothetical protein
MSITITEVRNARSTNAANTSIDVEINHPEYGWIPYLLTDYDTDMTINNDELLELIGSDYAAYVPPTKEELDAALAASIRGQRNNLLATEVDPLVTNPLRWAELTEAQQAAWTQYRRDLLDITAQAGFPNEVVWPTKPEVTP